MPVNLDAKSSFTATQTGLTSWTDASFTVGSGSHRALTVAIICESVSGSAPTAPTLNWDSTGTNQSMLLISSMNDNRASKEISIFLFGLVAPTSGNHTLAVGGLNANVNSRVIYSSWTGVDQTGGITTFKNAATNNAGSGTSLTATMAGNNGDMAIGVFCGNDGTPTINNNVWAYGTVFSVDYNIANFGLIGSSGSNALTMTQGSSANCDYNCVVLQQVAALAGGVFIDAVGSMQNTTTAVLTFSYTGITVGSSPNSALVIFLAHGTATNPTGITCVWDQAGANQTMTVVGSTTSSGLRIRTYALLSPVAGNKTLTISWTTADSVAVNAVSLGGVAQSSIGAAFLNQQVATYTTTATPSFSMTCSTPGTDMVIAQISSNQTIPGTPGFMPLWTGQTATSGYNIEAEATVASASPTVFHWTLGASTSGSLIGLEAQWDGVTGVVLTETPQSANSRMIYRPGLGPAAFKAALIPSDPPPVTVAAPAVTGGTLPFMGVG